MPAPRLESSRRLAMETLEPRQCLTTITAIDIKTGSSSSFPQAVALNGQFYVAADSGQFGRELFRLNADNSLTNVVDLAPGAASANVSNLTTSNGLLYFTVDAPAFGINFKALYRSDGTAAGTFGLLDQIKSLDLPMTQVGNQSYFAADRSFLGKELYKTDGTTSGTAMVKDIDPRYDAHPYGLPYGFSSSPNYLTNFNGQLFFSASYRQRELWKSNGTTAGTVMAVDVNPGTASSQLQGPVKFNDRMIFGAFVNNGWKLYGSDGTAAGTKLLASGFQSISNFKEANGVLYFAGKTASSGEELWKLPASGAPSLVKNIHPTGSSSPTQLTNANGKLYFVANDGSHGFELWQSDGTATGTVQVRDAFPGPGSSDPQILGNLNGVLFFSATDVDNGRELWQTNGVVSGARLVRDLNPGTASSDPSEMIVNGQEALFRAVKNSIGSELWRLKPAAPVMTLPSIAAQAFTKNGPVRLAPQGLLDDPDTSVFWGGKLSVSLGNTYRTADKVTLVPTSTVSLMQSKVLVSGVVVGVMTSSGNGRDLNVLFTQTATRAAVREVMRAVAFNNTAYSPYVGQRIVRFDLSDGEGAVANHRAVRINVENPAASAAPAPEGEGVYWAEFRVAMAERSSASAPTKRLK